MHDDLLWRRLFSVFIFLCIADLVLALPLSFTLRNRWQLWHHAADYHQATFIVQDAYFTHTRPPRARSTGRYFARAIGTIDGQQEEMNITRLLHPIPVTPGEEKLDGWTGKQLPVLFNPNVPKGYSQGETLRILPYEEDFAGRERGLFLKYLFWIVAPMVFFVAAALFCFRQARG